MNFSNSDFTGGKVPLEDERQDLNRDCRFIFNATISFESKAYGPMRIAWLRLNHSIRCNQFMLSPRENSQESISWQESAMEFSIGLFQLETPCSHDTNGNFISNRFSISGNTAAASVTVIADSLISSCSCSFIKTIHVEQAFEIIK